jgi:hypothetical protein
MAGVVLGNRIAMAGEHDQLLDYARAVAAGHREAMPPHWPAALRKLIAACWEHDPAKRPAFKEVLVRLYALKQAGVDEAMEAARPRGDYNPTMDCGCSIM